LGGETPAVAVRCGRVTVRSRRMGDRAASRDQWVSAPLFLFR
jgi:hypothetical protein